MIRTRPASPEKIGKLDVAITALFGIAAVSGMIADVSAKQVDGSVAAVPLFPLVVIPLLWRRVAPLEALVAMNAAVLFHVALFGEHAIRCGVVYPAAMLMAFSVAARLGRKPALLGLGLALALCGVVSFTDASSGATPLAMAFVGPVVVAIWATGRVVRSRAQLTEELAARTNELRTARDERARLEVTSERDRLSDELDQLLQRRLSELARLAEAGADDGDRAAANAALTQIEHESRGTLEQMRRVVGVLRSDGADAPMAPQPALPHLDALLVRAKGRGATLTVDGNARVLPAGVELSAYGTSSSTCSTRSRTSTTWRCAFTSATTASSSRSPARRAARAVTRSTARVSASGCTRERSS